MTALATARLMFVVIYSTANRMVDIVNRSIF